MSNMFQMPDRTSSWSNTSSHTAATWDWWLPKTTTQGLSTASDKEKFYWMP